MAPPTTTFSGHLFDGVSAQKRDATVTLTRLALSVTVDEQTTAWPWAQITQTQGRFVGEPIRLEYGPAPSQVLVLRDATFLAALAFIAPAWTSNIRGPRGSRTGLISLALVATVGLLVALYLWGVPALADTVTKRLPIEWEQKLGEAVEESLLAGEEVCDDSKAQAAVAQLVEQLQAGAPAHPYTLRVHVVKSSLVNAFALPGGIIVLYTGLIEAMDGPGEVAGVLAHEIQHVLLRHGTQSLVRELSLAILVGALLGDANGAMQTGIELAKQVGGLRYSRDTEREADRRGMHLLQTAKIDPQNMVRSFERLGKAVGEQGPVLSLISTHPDTAERIATLQKMAQSATFDAVALDDAAWRKALAGCKP